jgi:hypothetical protein
VPSLMRSTGARRMWLVVAGEGRRVWAPEGKIPKQLLARVKDVTSSPRAATPFPADPRR